MSKLRSSRIPLYSVRIEEKGRIRDIKEIVARVSGLPTCLNGQIVDLGRGVKGIIMGYDVEDVLVLVLGDRNKLRIGNQVTGISEPFTIPVGDNFLGRMVTALGEPCDQGEPVESFIRVPVFQDSAPLTHRAPMLDFMPTGTKAIDILLPLARGQRQLIVGDRMTGKTVIAVDAILHQHDKDVLCIYCAIGKSMSALGKVTGVLDDKNALEHTIMMVATDNTPVGEQYIIPYAAASMAGYFAGRGRNVLVVFDDLTKHAWAYRQLSLLLERPPGREAYPGDIFYVQTQLMERAGCFNELSGGGSVTFLGITETLHGDLTGYIPSNLASMCDGQIFTSSALFAEGNRPAIDVLLSNSIVGGRTQPPVIQELSRGIRAEFVRYMETVRLSRLQTELASETTKLVHRGRAITAFLQQNEHEPVTLVEMALLLYALRAGIMDGMDENQQRQFMRKVSGLEALRDAGMEEAVCNREGLSADLDQKFRNLLEGLAAFPGTGA